ncbi:MAG: GNAT family N-acetyltransferase [Anaerolineae bacterium]|nr:GNAT family N-acetyltransferase [Anaerolineae bacterium]
MHELDWEDFGRVLPLFEGLEVDKLALQLVIRGAYPGRVFVDRREEPTTALVAASTCYLGGDARDTELKELLVGEIVPGAESRPLFIYSTTDAWKETLDELLKDYQTMRIKRHKFELDPERFREHNGWRGRIPDGYEVRRIDETLVQSMPGHALEYWRDAGSFLAGGFGYAVVSEEEPISVCWTMLVGNGITELAIQTDEAYRRRGFAVLAACACIEHCLEEGLRAEWDCFEMPPSMNLAQKLGFVKKKEAELYFVKPSA